MRGPPCEESAGRLSVLGNICAERERDWAEDLGLVFLVASGGLFHRPPHRILRALRALLSSHGTECTVEISLRWTKANRPIVDQFRGPFCTTVVVATAVK